MKTIFKYLLVAATIVLLAPTQTSAQCDPGFVSGRIEILTDQYPENSFQIKDACTGDVLFDSGLLFDPETLYALDFCADPAGHYEFVINDAYGDGLCCPTGSYSVTYDGNVVGSGSGDFGFSASVLFGNPDPCPPPQPAPANDLCADAASISCGDAVAGTNIDATEEFSGSKGVWYKLTGTSGRTTLTTCSSADFDTRITVYTGGCDGLFQVAFNDDDFNCPTGGLRSTVSFCSAEGEEYLIKVDGFNGATGNFELGATCVASSVANDNICDAQLLTVGDLTAFDNSCATVEAGEPSPGAGSGLSTCQSQDGWCEFETGLQNTVWFKFVTPHSRAVTIRSAFDAPPFDTQLALWESSGGCSGTLNLVAANDDNSAGGFGDFSSEITPVYCLKPNTEYYVQVDGFNGFQGSGTVIVEEVADKKVLVCHKQGKKFKTIEVSGCALDAHLAHGDLLGACAQQRLGSFDEEESAIDNVLATSIKAYPNPFSEKTNIEFTLPEYSERVTLEVFSLTGQKLATLFEGSVEENEINSFEFSAKDLSGSMFVYVLQTGTEVHIGKLSMNR